MNFLGMGPGELLLVLLLALIVFGPGKLPEVGNALGKSIREFRRATSEISQELAQPLNEVKRPLTEALGSAVNDVAAASSAETASATGVPCPHCSSTNPPTNRFCGACGAPLT